MLTELVVVLGVLVIFLLLAVPANRNATVRCDGFKCSNNLKNVGLALRIFATDNGGSFPMLVSTNQQGSPERASPAEVFVRFQSMSNELNVTRILVCPADDREAAISWSGLRNSNISYFMGLNSKMTGPRLLVAGDRNLTRNGAPIRSGILEVSTNIALGWSRELHVGRGNIVLGDGSVQQVGSGSLRALVATPGFSPTLLAVP